jgi:hypothetical protein
LEHVIGSSENTIGFVTEDGSESSSLSLASTNHLRYIKPEHEDKTTCRPIPTRRSCRRQIHNDIYGQEPIDTTRTQLASYPRKGMSEKIQNSGIDGVPVGLHATSKMNGALLQLL